MQIKKQDVPAKLLELIQRTEDNVEQVLLHLHAMRTEDLPHIKWEWDEWQPALLSEETYPQFHLVDGAAKTTYQALWAVPLCGRDQTQQWQDKAALDAGTARQVLLFQFEVEAVGDEAGKMSLECFLGMYPGYKSANGTTVESVFRNSDGNTMPVTVLFLIEMANRIEDLAHYVKLERRAITAMSDIKQQHEAWAAEAIRNRKPEKK